ncbi:DNA-binding response regulator, NarL/FixJ family, contains REC and HTH domains [Actinopolymorpha cephalotaxi]|uniref:DNA-binding NarL/FixJ family response regulator n=1 Tax=Actinopolymorpha cephalotaxi TaxID=504797 RepID=A0A1I2YHB0_9ACTN|nr:response regulator transcription factor [Actinopolymorpha cephalotaxi]NYH86971.1 DNA-binding NarL/FixJ family response regulator [Actinopolymorpha cephalotaxi]SFH24995.1 DNA-binding response regulator, NarL/FixJ family, contains REC and HTH domains [Actinopolymorpha cephalotaxi]
MTGIRVVLVDDQYLVRTGLRALLDRAPDIAVVGEAGDGATALGVVRAQRPDVVLMDVRMPGTDGLEATRRILDDRDLSDVRVVMLTTFDDDEYLFEAIRAGAAGFLLKDTAPDALRDAVRTVAGGDALLSPAVTRRVLAAAARSPVADPARLDGLTDRERDVLAQVGAGRSNAEIGSVLHLSPDTARTYVSRLLAKLNARDRSQLVVIAYESGLVRPGQS